MWCHATGYVVPVVLEVLFTFGVLGTTHAETQCKTTCKAWIFIITTVRTLDVRCHNVTCPHVACTVQATLCYIHWMVLTHPTVNLDQYPFDFHVFSPYKKALDFSQMKSERCCNNSDRSSRNFFRRRSVEYCVNGMLISVVMEIFLMVCPCLPRAISKCV
jgi:hypothetical protein